jgi:parvulin-like peptidyl-prolyl isomerase
VHRTAHRTARRAAVALVAALVLSACGGDLPRDAVATVDGEPIAAGPLEAWVRTATEANPALVEADLQRDLLTRAIHNRIVLGVLAERGLEVTDEAVAAVAADVEAQVGGAAALETTLVEIGWPREFYDELFVRTEAAIDVLVSDLVADRALETRTARHILVGTAEEADEIVALLAEGADFAALAAERSTDPGSAAEGGLLGARERGVFVPEFDAAVWSARLGVVLDPVESQFGFHVIEVVDEASVPAAELSSPERRQLAGAELDGLLGGAVTAAEVEVRSRIGTWDAVAGLVVAPQAVGADRW